MRCRAHYLRIRDPLTVTSLWLTPRPYGLQLLVNALAAYTYVSYRYANAHALLTVFLFSIPRSIGQPSVI